MAPEPIRKDAEIGGQLHDVGKYSDAAQRRLRGSPEQVDHSTAGAFLATQGNNLPVAMSIAGHHSGLLDFGGAFYVSGSFRSRIMKALKGEIEPFDAYKDEIHCDIHSFDPTGMSNYDIYMRTKMIFSTMVDADWLDTDAFYNDTTAQIPRIKIDKLAAELDAFTSKWDKPTTWLNQLRTRILKTATERASFEPGLFSLTVPTGGGKTITSMSFALHHALAHGKKRIIYVIPYCSIIEQTDATFKAILKGDNVLAHYSGADISSAANDPAAERLARLAENWDAPIVVTTAVQFFESLYSATPGKNRKLHNIADSVIIFDEAQMLPIPFLRPCVSAICHLVQHFGVSAVLCTATQPALNRLIAEYANGLRVRELCPDPSYMYDQFRRTKYQYEGKISKQELVERLSKHNQVLCIVNTRKRAQELYSLLQSDGQLDGTYHLSALMDADNRREVISEIKKRLKSGLTCRVISTNLIEAGVDIDFPTVYRALAGLDSIIQAGGRCNREGKRPTEDCIVHVFVESGFQPPMLDQPIAATLRVFQQFGDQMDSPEAVSTYFEFLYYTLKAKQLDEYEIIQDAEGLKFETVSEHMHLIDGADYTVYIPTAKSEPFIRELQQSGPTKKLLRLLAPFAVTVYEQQFQMLKDANALILVSDNVGILCDPCFYSSDTGLKLNT